MKKNILNIFLILAVAPFLVQCATQEDIKTLNYQLRIVNKKIDDMKVGTVGQMQKRQAASSSQIDEVKKEVLVLKGQLEETAHLNRLLREQNKELEASFQLYSKKVELERQKALDDFELRDQQKNAQLSQLEEKLAKQQGMVQAIQDARIREAERKAKEAARAAEAAKEKARASSNVLSRSKNSRIVHITADKKKRLIKKGINSSTTVTTGTITKQSAATLPANSVGNLIEAADKEFANGNFQQAFKYYDKFTETNPTGDKNITARFMMGECLFHQKEYDQAILQYQKIISNHPRHPRAASALLKQGMAFERLSDIETAKIIYKKIITSYSSSPEAATANERRNNLN